MLFYILDLFYWRISLLPIISQITDYPVYSLSDWCNLQILYFLKNTYHLTTQFYYNFYKKRIKATTT